MNMDKHTNRVCRPGYTQLRQSGHVRKYLTTDATKSSVNAVVTIASRLDYRNALLIGVPKTMLDMLQTVQNTAACIIKPGRVAQSVGHLTRMSGVPGSTPGLATYFRFSFRFFKKGSCQLLAKVCARSTG